MKHQDSETVVVRSLKSLRRENEARDVKSIAAVRHLVCSVTSAMQNPDCESKSVREQVAIRDLLCLILHREPSDEEFEIARGCP